MADRNETSGFVVSQSRLPEKFPTHLHSAEFWEALGRTVATFSFLEEVLGKAIYALTATEIYETDELAMAAYEAWLPKLERALKDPLGALIDRFANSAKPHNENLPPDFDDLLSKLRAVKDYRNVLCHGSWRAPDEAEKSLPLFVNRNMEIWEKTFDVDLLSQIQQHVTELCCKTINTLTSMGWQFPGSQGPGRII